MLFPTLFSSPESPRNYEEKGHFTFYSCIQRCLKGARPIVSHEHCKALGSTPPGPTLDPHWNRPRIISFCANLAGIWVLSILVLLSHYQLKHKHQNVCYEELLSAGAYFRGRLGNATDQGEEQNFKFFPCGDVCQLT